jgi:phosphoribosylcarboxyaminoimidazole (NCAIR) mutase
MKNLHETLRTVRADAPAPSGADAFWSEFECRAAGVARVPRVATTGPLARAASVAGAILLAAGAGTWALLPGAAQAGIRIDSLSVPVEHDSVFVINDAAGEGTIVLIGGLQPQDPPEERP